MLKWREVDVTDGPLGVGMILTTVWCPYLSSNSRLIRSWSRVYYHYSGRLVGVYELLIMPPSYWLYFRYRNPSPELPQIPSAQSTLINGLGRQKNDSTSPLAVISVLQHKRYRFRLISMSCSPNYVFSIDGHTMVCFWCLDIMFLNSTFWTFPVDNHRSWWYKHWTAPRRLYSDIRRPTLFCHSDRRPAFLELLDTCQSQQR